MTAMAMSPQSAVLLLLQTDPGVNAVLNFGGPVRFADLPLIANTVLQSSGSIDFADTDLGTADPADLLAARDSLAWLNDQIGDGSTRDEDPSVLVVERGRWREGMFRALVRESPFPSDRIVAGVIDAPAADRCLVVPTGGGAGTADAVMLYGRHRRPSRPTLIPFILRPGPKPATAAHDPCELSDDATVDCVDNGCAGNCVLEMAYENRFLVKLGCWCH
jgi:hypothetical protein